MARSLRRKGRWLFSTLLLAQRPTSCFSALPSSRCTHDRNAVCSVSRQYAGFAGKITNCQISVFATYVSHRGHASASWTPTAPWRVAIVASVLIAMTGTAALHFLFYRQINMLYSQVEAARAPPPAGSIIVAANLLTARSSVAGHSVGWKMNLTDHFREIYARKYNLPMLNIELLAPQVFGYFPVIYRPEVTVDAALKSKPFKDYREPLATFERATDLRIAEVSFWPNPDPGMPSRWLDKPGGSPPSNWISPEREEALRSELRARWQPIVLSNPLAPLTFTHRHPLTELPRAITVVRVSDMRPAP